MKKVARSKKKADINKQKCALHFFKIAIKVAARTSVFLNFAYFLILQNNK